MQNPGNYLVLLEISPRPASELSDEQTLERCRQLYSKRSMLDIGYGDAVCGNRLARRGLVAAIDDQKSEATWRDVGPRYRKLLYGIGESNSAIHGLSEEAVAAVGVHFSVCK